MKPKLLGIRCPRCNADILTEPRKETPRCPKCNHILTRAIERRLEELDK